MRDRIVDAIDVLNDLVGDLGTGTNVLRDYHAQAAAGKMPADILSGVQRLCVSHIVLGCCKFIEFYERFHDVVPEEHRPVAKRLLKELNARGMVEFRNTVAGHIRHNQLGRPLRNSEITGLLQEMMRGSVEGFLSWVNELQSGARNETVTAVIESLRDALIELHEVSPDEVLRR